jgi:predicted nucleotidyltransferase
MLDKVNELLEHKGELIYLCKFGSHLYGTNSEASDLDYKGIFIPYKRNLILGKKCDNIVYSSGNKRERNTNEDIDISLWSIHKFIDLVKIGDTNALDLLFSLTHENCVIYNNGELDTLMYNALKLFNPIKTKSFVNYAINQAKKYGIKTSRLGTLKEVYNYIKDSSLNEEDKVFTLIKNIDNRFHNDSFCFLKEFNEVESLVLCGKVHQGNISVKEFINRITKEYKKYGHRARLAEQNKGIDEKSLSHAIRAIIQLKQLLREGNITFPLKEAQILKDIKYGKYTWKLCEEMIINGLAEVEELQKTSIIKGKTDNKFIDTFILNLYGE